MKAILLGTGSPQPDPQRHGAAVAVSVGEDWLLFDAGRGVVLQAVRAGIPLGDVNPVFISHHHFDHIGDLFDVIISTWIGGRTGPLKIFGPSGTSEIVTALIQQVYARDIAFRVGEFHAKPSKQYDGRDIAALEMHDVGAGPVHDTERYRVSAEYVSHRYGADAPTFDWVCLGYRIEADGRVLAISGDTVMCDGLDRLARGADTLIQCCFLAEAEITSPNAEHTAKYVLASSGQAGKTAARAGVKRLVLTHFRVTSDENLRRMVDDARQEFGGEVVAGQDLMELEI